MNVVKKIPIFTLLSKNISSNIYIKKEERKQRRLEDSLNLDRNSQVVLYLTLEVAS